MGQYMSRTFALFLLQRIHFGGACVQSIIMDLVKAVLGKRARHHHLHKQGTVSGPPWSARGDGYTVIMDEGCADLCHTERPLQTQQAGHDRKVRKPDTLHWGRKNLESSDTVSRRVKWVNYCGKEFRQFFKTLKEGFLYNPIVSLLEVPPEDSKTGTRLLKRECSQQYFSQSLPGGNNPNTHQLTEG